MTSTMLIEPEELKSRLGDHKLIVLDASWYLPNMNRDARAEYEQAHIPGAVFYDIDLHSDPDSDLPHMLPSPTAFAKSAGNLGISSEHKIVVYDGAGLFSAARVWWAFRLMGAEDVRILNGGLPAWNEAGYRLEVGDVSRDPTTFNARFNQGAVRSIQDVVGAIETADAQIVDARAAARFRGEAPEPRAGLRSGHMPGAFNIPVDTLLSGGRLKPVEELK
ncbi:MAG: rhodanese-like domain-containing protein, partial [Pseudomonadota bacterium]